MDNNKKTMLTCIGCNEYHSTDSVAIRRHVAITHGQGTFSTLGCRKCHQRFFDNEHFMDHLRTSELCKMIEDSPLPDHMRIAFESLVAQIMQPESPQKQQQQAAATTPTKHDQQLPLATGTGTAALATHENVNGGLLIAPSTVPKYRDRSMMQRRNRSIAAAVARLHQSSTATSTPTMPTMTTKPKPTTHQQQMELQYIDVGDGGRSKIKHADAAKYGFGSPPTMVKSNGAIHDGAGAALAMGGDIDDMEAPEPLPIDRSWSTPPRRGRGRRSGFRGAGGRRRSRVPSSQAQRLRQILGHRARITCKLCNSCLNSSTTFGPSEHAKRHTTLPLYECKMCQMSSSDRCAIYRHITKDHGIVGDSSLFLNHSARYEDETLRKFEECFGNVDAKPTGGGRRRAGRGTGRGSFRGRPAAAPLVSSGRLVPKLTIRLGNPEPQPPMMAMAAAAAALAAPAARTTKESVNYRRGQPQPYLCDLVRRHGQQVRALRCKICGKDLPVRVKTGYNAITTIHLRVHVQKHLDKPTAKCRYCGTERPTIIDMDKHMTQMHPNVRMRSGFIDQSYLFEDELRAMAFACFDYYGHEANGVAGAGGFASPRSFAGDQSRENAYFASPHHNGHSSTNGGAMLAIDEFADQPSTSSVAWKVDPELDDDEEEGEGLDQKGVVFPTISLQNSGNGSIFEMAPFKCDYPGCGMTFFYHIIAKNHVRLMHKNFQSELLTK